MIVGQGKFKIDPVKYYSLSSQAFTNPQWFFKTFYPKIKIEVIYTMLALTTAATALLSAFLGILGGNWSAISAIFFQPIGVLFGLGIGTVFMFFFSQWVAKNKLDLNGALKFTGFFMTWSIPMHLGSALPSMGLSMFFISLYLIAVVYLGYVALKHFLEVSPTVLLVHNALVAITLVMWIGTAMTVVQTANALNSYTAHNKKAFKHKLLMDKKLKEKYAH